MLDIYNFLNKIDKLLIEKNIPKTIFYKEVGISSGNFSDWKKGRSKPSILSIGKIASYLNCSPEYLLEDKESNFLDTNNCDYNSIDNVALAQRIKDKCKDNNITINQLTEECGLSKGFIYELEKRDKSLSSDRIYRIANYLNCSSDYLLGIELKNNEQEKKLLNLFNQLDEDYKKQAISQVFQLVVKMSNEQDEELNSKKAYIAALGGGVMQIDEDLAKYIEENIVVDEYKPNNKF